MYLEHFGFSDYPFTLTPNLNFYCELEAYKDALDLVLLCLANGEGFIKVTGEVGTGKTLLCKKILENLGDNYITAYISNPNLDCFNLQKAIARELEIPFSENIDQYGLLSLLTERFITANHANQRVIIIIDEAHVLSDEALDGLRLLSNLETATSKLIQILLVGQPELDKRLRKPSLRQLNQRIVFSYKLPTLSKKEFQVYLSHRLVKAGYTKPYVTLFSNTAANLIHKASNGIPRLINILAHKALLISFGHNKTSVSPKYVKIAIKDTESINQGNLNSLFEQSTLELGIFVFLLISLGFGTYLISNYIAQGLFNP
jgi:MSHA biogenesis protein MshM